MELENGEILQMLGRGIRFLRKRAGLTQQELGELVGLNPNYISAIERGQRNVTIITLEKLGQGLGVDIDEMLYICCKHGYKKKAPGGDKDNENQAQGMFSVSPEEKQFLILLRNIKSNEIQNAIKTLLMTIVKANKANNNSSEEDIFNEEDISKTEET